MLPDITTGLVQATMADKLRQAEKARSSRALRREAIAANQAAEAETASTSPSTSVVRTHRHPRLWALTHLHHA
jgi:hypothetical protein